MNNDPTENVRRELVAEINSVQAQREQMEQEHGQVWNTDELGRDFSVQGFMAPFVLVKRKSDGVRGTLMFQHSPRFYFGFSPD
jgi:hypothetical protein